MTGSVVEAVSWVSIGGSLIIFKSYKRKKPLSGLLGALQLTFKLRQNLEQIPHQAIVGDLEDGRFVVFVDGDDHF
ncbi:hypothetical protein HSBAA_34640 [Vreelandella sulfidaeris]|uniref:Uncharacterized protein n=1 Tax=Vreelandella sulfidaeris TaxID=115553 RepID=A0A455UCX1_9GAMM|nr:hypothetical protein HSBAA_34640 [Halomonas sulfidaeris]